MHRIDTSAAPGWVRSFRLAGLAALIVGAFLASAAGAAPAPNARACTRNCPPPAKAPTPAPAASTPAAPARTAEPSGPDEVFLAARNAVARGDAARFDALAARVGATHPLAAYVDAWRLRMQLADYRADTAGPLDADARALVARLAGTLAGETARRDWLMSLGRRQVWGTFDEAWAGLAQRDDPALRCYALQSRAAGGEPVIAAARELLMQPRELPDACSNLLGALVANGQAGANDLWHRLEAAIESGSPAAIRRAANAAAPRLDAKQLEVALSRPATALEPAPTREAAPTREVAAIAIPMLARSDPAEAAARLEQLGPRMRAADRAFAWSQVAAAGMRRLLPESHAWARQARSARATDETLGWLVRAALRARDWPAVRGTIERMSEAGRSDPT